MALNGGGGAFLSTLKEKNERQRAARDRATTAGSMQSTNLKKKSMFGSFFGGSTKKKSSNSNSFLEAAREASQEPDPDQTNEIPNTVDEVISTGITQDNHTGASIPSNDKNTVEEKAEEKSSESKVIARILVKEKVESGIQQPEPLSPTPHVIRETSSMGILERETSHRGSTSHPTRQRRVSTTVESSGRRASISAVAEGTEGRERTYSEATMEEVYGRTGRDPRNFEMINPLLQGSSPYHQQRRTLSVSMSAAEVDAERTKRASLYNSAPHVDQVMLLERRNTRAGRSPSMDVRESHSRSSIEQVEIASS